MDLPDMDSDVTESSSVIFFSNDDYDQNEHCNSNAVVVSVNYDQTDFKNYTAQHMDKLGAGVIECGSASDENAESVVYEEYEVADTMVSSTDNNEIIYSFDVDQNPNSSYNAEHQIADQDETVEDGEQTYLEDGKIKETFNVESLSYELQVGYRILSNMMSASNRCVNKLFLYPVDDNYPETSDYYEKIKEPMWMFKMKEKFESHQYKALTDFTADFRLMIENCYRFNGPDNFVSKKAQKLETMMKQKIALLSRDLREKILGNMSNSEDDILTSAGIRRRVRNPNMSDDPSQQLLSQLRRDREMQEKVDRKQKVEDRKAMEQARLQELQEWEDKMLGPEIKEKIRTMWELPQIGLFVYLCMESLGLEEEVTQYQLERGIALPRECSDFKRLMTCLLSTPHQRKSLKSFMPYHVWNSKLSVKVDYFYKVLAEKKGNHIQACYKLGLDTRAFKMMGKANPLLKKKFHELSFLKRVWILKNYCDFCMTQWMYAEVLLKYDGRGSQYTNFPMFTGKDTRIFKHSKTPEPSLESLAMVDWSLEVDKAESKEASPLRDTSRIVSDGLESKTDISQVSASDAAENNPSNGKITGIKRRKRASLFTGKRKRLKTGKKPLVSSKSSDSCDVNDEECDENELDSSDIQDGANSSMDNLNKSLESNKSIHAKENSEKNTSPPIKQDERLVKKPLSNSSTLQCTDGQIGKIDTPTVPLEGSECVKNDPEKKQNNELQSSEVCDIKREPLDESHAELVTPSADKTAELKISKEEAGVDAGIKMEDSKEAQLNNNRPSDEVKIEDVKKEEVEDDAGDETDEEDLPDVGYIELVAESMEDIRQLMNKLSNPEPIKRGKRTYPGVMKPCEEELLANVTRFHDELLKYEKSLSNARVSMQSKLRKEVECYVEPKVEETKDWDSDHSQTSKDSSDDEDVGTKLESDAVKQSKRIMKKPASSTAALLTSAASKLSCISGDGNEDSNDSFELDISSRGRLRKRRVIPNNTEDTGLKKRKNIPNQENFFSPQLSLVSSSVAMTSAVSLASATSGLQSSISSQPQKTILSNAASLLRAPHPNSAIKAQLSSPAGQILRLVSPAGDGTIRTLHVSGKPNMIISPQSLSNLRFISSSGVVTFPRNTVSTSSAQNSHPVIQQLLLNQSKSVTQTASKTVNSLPRLVRPFQSSDAQSAVTGAVKMSHVVTVPSSVSTLSSKLISPQSGSQVGSKQLMDIGLSVSQIQQLIKNQAIQISTGAGNPATLVLTSGLQVPASSASVNLATNSPVQIRLPSGATLPVQQSKTAVTGISSLMTMISKAQNTSGTPSQVLVNSNSLSPLTAVQGQSLQQLIRPQSGPMVRVSAPLITEGVNSSKLGITLAQTTGIRSNTLVSSVAGQAAVSANLQQAVMRQGSVRAAISPGQKLLPVPRIVGSVSPLSNLRVTVASNMATSMAPSYQVTSAASQELAKAKVINVPVLSPAKKYAGNVTVKALLENRGPKKFGDDDSDCGQVSDSAEFSEVLENGNTGGSSATSTFQSHMVEAGLTMTPFSLPNSAVSLPALPHIHPLSVDTGISSSRNTVSATSSEVIVPTVNIKVPSPNTLPSVLHNKNGTTIVQSTRVPIPVVSEAKTGDSLSPVGHQNSSAVHVLGRAPGFPSSGVVISPPSSIVGNKLISSTVVSQPLASSVAATKNIMLKVTPQTGGPGQFVQGFMTPRGLVIPQSALLQQQQNNVLISNVSQPGNITQIQPGSITQTQYGNMVQVQSGSITQIQQSANQKSFPPASHGQQSITQQLQQQSPQQLLVAPPPSSAGLVKPNPNHSLKVMFLNSGVTCNQPSLTTNSIITSAQQLQPTNTPASELVKQLANNSHVQGNIQQQQQLAISSGGNQHATPHILSNMIQGTNLQITSSSILPTQTIVNAGVAPQLAQIFTLQQGNQIQQQPNIMLTTTKPSTVVNKPPVVAVQLQQLGQFLNLGGVSQVQLPQQQVAPMQLGSGSRIAQPNQVLQLAINQTGSQTIMAAPHAPQVVRVATQLSPQNQGLTQLQQQGGNIIIQQPQQGQSIVVQQQGVVGTPSSVSHQFQGQVSKANPLSVNKIQTPVIGQAQSSNSLVLSQLQSPVVSLAPTSVNQIQYVINPSSAAQPNVGVVQSPLNKMSIGPVTGSVNRIIRADSSSALQVISSPGNLISNTIRHASTLNNKGGISQMIIPNTATGQYLISPVKLATQSQQPNLISPIKYIGALQSPNSGQSTAQFVVNPAMAGLPAQVTVKPSVIYASQANIEKKEGKVAQLLLSHPASSSSVNNAQQTSTAMSVNIGASPVVSKLAGGDAGTKTILYKIGDQYFSPAANLSGASLQQGTGQPPVSANMIPAGGAVAANTKTDIQLLVPPACIEASDQILKHNNAVASTSLVSTSAPQGFSPAQNFVQNRSNGTVRNSETSGAVNGIHQGSTQFSFSLSGPATLNPKPPVRSDGQVFVNGQSPASGNSQSSGVVSGQLMNSSKAHLSQGQVATPDTLLCMFGMKGLEEIAWSPNSIEIVNILLKVSPLMFPLFVMLITFHYNSKN
ncbi:hypothetical protein Btru_043080 [Bulinus truncatus]|nr:hypothetical protein Btru_043080 [Bulinus truncatus]